MVLYAAVSTKHKVNNIHLVSHTPVIDKCLTLGVQLQINELTLLGA